jgi:hypothetical protein
LISSTSFSISARMTSIPFGSGDSRQVAQDVAIKPWRRNRAQRATERQLEAPI